MTVERNYDTMTIVASQDLTGHQFKAVAINGGVAPTSALAAGILRNKAAAGDHATVAYKGQIKAVVGAAVVSGALVGVTASGFLITVTGSHYVGRSLVSAASGDIMPLIADFNMGRIA